MLKKSHHHLYPQRNVIRKNVINKNVLKVPEELLAFSDSSKSSKSEKSSENQSFKSPGQQSSRSINIGNFYQRILVSLNIIKCFL